MPAPPGLKKNRPRCGLATMNKFKPYLVTAAVCVVVMAIVFRFAPANIRSAILGG